MDVKGIKWFGNVYQKFETMCLEVEEAVCQDTVKYVENQVQTVGASVKKFYSEVVDDLLSPSLMDPVKVNSLSCTGAHKKPKMGIKDEPKRQLFEDRNATTKMDKNPTYAPSLDRFSNTDPAVPCNPASHTAESKSVGLLPKKVNLVIKRKPKTVMQNSSEVPKETDPGASVPKKESVTSGALKIESIEAPTDLNFEQQLDPDAVSRDSKETRWNKTGGGNKEDFKLNLIADASVNPVKKIIAAGTGTCHPKDSLVGRSSENEVVYKSMHPTDAVYDYANIPSSESFSVPNEAGTFEGSYADGNTKNKDAFGYNNPYSEEWTAQTEATDGWNIETITSDDDDDDDDDDNNDSVEAGAEIIEINFKNNTALEESCIIIDRDNLPFCSHKEPKHKSYKKKFREAFSSRGKSTIKKEYRKLAALYESTSCDSLHASSSTTEERKLKSSAAQLCDSEWEIL